MADVLLQPVVPAGGDRTATRRARSAGLMQQRAQPGFLAQETFNRVVFGDHPGGARVADAGGARRASRRDALVEFHKAHYVPDHADPRVRRRHHRRRRRKSWRRRRSAPGRSRAQPVAAGREPARRSAGRRSSSSRGPSSVQTTSVVGTQSIERTDPDYEALTVANRVLGGAMGRLFGHLREEKGYTYGAAAASARRASRARGSRQHRRAHRSHRSGADRPARRDPPDARHAGARQGARRREARDRRRLRAVAREPQRGAAATTSTATSTSCRPTTGTPTRRASGGHRGRRAARRRRSTGPPIALQIVAVGDATKIEPALQEARQLEVYDAEGKPIK